jgi:glycerophosphoryl diester phosphodiesterase
LQQYNIGMLRPQTKYGSYFSHQQALPDAKIPTLKEVIAYVKKVAGASVGFQIEIKTDPTRPELTATPSEFASALHRLLKEEEIVDRTEVQAFDWRCLVALQKLDARIKTAYLFDHTTIKLDETETVTWKAGLLPKDFGYSLPRMVKSLGGHCFEPYEKVALTKMGLTKIELTQEMVMEAHRLGLKVVPWGWPEEEGCEFNAPRVAKLIAWGVDGIITDRPDELRSMLEKMGKPVPQQFGVPGGWLCSKMSHT